ncbi:MAG: hypothetical protein RL291_2032 [Pseudomonadota bacterium]
MRITSRTRLITLAFAALFGAFQIAHAQTPLPTEERQRRSMIEAAERGDLSAINRLIIAGTPIDVRDEMGRTGLLAAIEKGQTEAALLFIKEGANINAVALNRDTPWLLAGARGNRRALEVMWPKGPDLSLRNRFGGTALIPACHYAHVDTVRFLLTTTIDVDHVNNLGWTCLLEAVILGDGSAPYQEIVRMVLGKGAKANLPDKNGITPLAHARQRGQSAIVRILEAAGAR